MFLEVAVETAARTVVTGNLRQFPSPCRGPVTVLSPPIGLERFAGLAHP